VILNLLSNAKDAIIASGKKGGKITISLESDETNVRLIIQDNGGGIKIEPLERIFEPYVSTKEQNEGTGIGLYMAKLIIEKSMRGKLEAKNENEGIKSRKRKLIHKFHILFNISCIVFRDKSIDK
jgi:signal transduction histidine kinase